MCFALIDAHFAFPFGEEDFQYTYSYGGLLRIRYDVSRTKDHLICLCHTAVGMWTDLDLVNVAMDP